MRSDRQSTLARRGATRAAPSSLAAAAACAALLAVAPARADTSNLEFKLFGDANFAVKNHDPVSNTFTAARLDLFATYDLERVSFLSEVQFEAGTDNNVEVDIERMQVSYMFGDWLRIKAGRSHTAFGYYNDAYHHGTIFELATSRPMFVNFEDSGGLIESHIVGVGADGRVHAGKVDVHYDLEVGNGRGSNIQEVTLFDAKKSAKVVNLRLRLLPSFVEGLVIGGNALYDQVPAAPHGTSPSADVPHMLHEIDVGAHVAYMESGWHLLAEGAMFQHREDATGSVYTSFAGFVELGKALGDFTPYARYEHLRLDPKGDPLFQTGTLKDAGIVNDFRVGVKWFATPNIAIKLEGRTFHSEVVHSQQSVSAQCAFGF